MPNLQREQVLLVALSLANGAPFTPVQVQKALFLAMKKLPDAFAPASRYDFQPYDYGPFDRHVYVDAEALERNGLAEICVDGRGWNTYAATREGIQQGQQLQAALAPEERDMLGRIVGLVRSLSFSELVSAIYRAYPEMQIRSVFRD